jgi:ATP-dependent Clp protease protease subunit
MDKFWKWAKDEAGNETELLLEGVIASSSWWGDEVTPKAFKNELKKHTGDITVRINSPGGDVFAGVSIYNALVEHDGKVTVKVDALAASAASFVAMAGEDIIMLPGSMMMIHNPWTLAVGDKDDLAKVVEMLEKTGESIASIYVARTGKSEEEIADLLAAETWMTAQEAVDLGFATEAQEPKKPTVSDSIKNALNFASTVRNAVMQPAMSIKEKADALEVEEINVSDTTKKPAKAAAGKPKTPDTPKADDPKVKTKATEPAEPVAEVKELLSQKISLLQTQTPRQRLKITSNPPKQWTCLPVFLKQTPAKRAAKAQPRYATHGKSTLKLKPV